jgi:NRPS condensation-like uncharacterized protein
MNFKPNTCYRAEPVGQLYSSLRTRKNTSTYAINAYLNENINPEILQQAVNDLINRLPFLNVRLKKGAFAYLYKILDKPLKIRKTYEMPNKVNLFQVLYSDRILTIDVMHGVCDARIAGRILSALLTRYFELQGMKLNKTDIIDCEQVLSAEETEDAFDRYGNNKDVPIPQKSLFGEEAYKSGKTVKQDWKSKTFKFQLDKLKNRAKQYDATVNQYILYHIFMALAEERAERKSNKTIAALIPVDLRRFYPSNTLHNFATGITVTMPETQDISEMIKQLQEQFKNIDNDCALSQITMIQKMGAGLKFLPLAIKKYLLRLADGLNTKGISTTFSNIGIVKLPKEIEDKINLMEITMDCTPFTTYAFTCISFGNTISLTVMMPKDDDGILPDKMKYL